MGDLLAGVGGSFWLWLGLPLLVLWLLRVFKPFQWVRRRFQNG